MSADYHLGNAMLNTDWRVGEGQRGGGEVVVVGGQGAIRQGEWAAYQRKCTMLSALYVEAAEAGMSEIYPHTFKSGDFTRNFWATWIQIYTNISKCHDFVGKGFLRYKNEPVLIISYKQLNIAKMRQIALTV